MLFADLTFVSFDFHLCDRVIAAGPTTHEHLVHVINVKKERERVVGLTSDRKQREEQGDSDSEERERERWKGRLACLIHTPPPSPPPTTVCHSVCLLWDPHLCTTQPAPTDTAKPAQCHNIANSIHVAVIPHTHTNTDSVRWSVCWYVFAWDCKHR